MLILQKKKKTQKHNAILSKESNCVYVDRESSSQDIKEVGGEGEEERKEKEKEGGKEVFIQMFLHFNFLLMSPSVLEVYLKLFSILSPHNFIVKFELLDNNS